LETKEKMAGPARYHSFFDSTMNCLKKSLGLVIRSMSGAAAVNIAVFDDGELGKGKFVLIPWRCSFGLGVRSGCFESSMNVAQEGREFGASGERL